MKRRHEIQDDPDSPQRVSTKLNSGDLAAIQESDRQIRQRKDLDWKKASALLRKKYLHK